MRGGSASFQHSTCKQTVNKPNYGVVQLVATDLSWVGSAQRSGQGESFPSPHPFGGGKPPLEHSKATVSNSQRTWQSTTANTAVRFIVALLQEPFCELFRSGHRYLTVPGGARSASLKKDARRRLVSSPPCACMCMRPNDRRKRHGLKVTELFCTGKAHAMRKI